MRRHSCWARSSPVTADQLPRRHPQVLPLALGVLMRLTKFLFVLCVLALVAFVVIQYRAGVRADEIGAVGNFFNAPAMAALAVGASAAGVMVFRRRRAKRSR